MTPIHNQEDQANPQEPLCRDYLPVAKGAKGMRSETGKLTSEGISAERSGRTGPPELRQSVDGQALATGPPAERAAEPDDKPSVFGILVSALKEIVQVVLPAVALALLIHVFLAQATVVFGQSMQPNLKPNERLVIEKLSYYLHEPGRNEIIVIDMPGMPALMIKRIVGLPGETVEMGQGRVYIDGREIPQPYTLKFSETSYGPVTLEADTYFVLGDNRDNSNDSRSFGPIHRDVIAGRAWMRYWPLPRLTFFK